MFQIQQDLSHQCNQCGNCCSATQEGDIFLYPRDAQRLSHFFNQDLRIFLSQYTKIVEYEIESTNKEPNQENYKEYIPIFALTVNQKTGCVFFDAAEKKCAVYSVRPDQCRFFPFIYCVLEDISQWKPMIETCQVIKHFNSYFQKSTNEDIHTFSKNITVQERKIEQEYYNFLKRQNMHNDEQSKKKKWNLLEYSQQREILANLYVLYLKEEAFDKKKGK